MFGTHKFEVGQRVRPSGAGIAAMSLRHGENVVNLETINRKFQGVGDRPCDVN